LAFARSATAQRRVEANGVKISTPRYEIEQEERRNGGEGMSKALIFLSSSVSPFLMFDLIFFIFIRHWDLGRAVAWRFAPMGADQIAQNAAVMAFVVGSRTTAVGASPEMHMASPGYPNPECLFGESIDVQGFGVGDEGDDHSFPWNYWSAKTWFMHQQLLERMP
jgi:hypothetical protein